MEIHCYHRQTFASGGISSVDACVRSYVIPHFRFWLLTQHIESILIAQRFVFMECECWKPHTVSLFLLWTFSAYRSFSFNITCMYQSIANLGCCKLPSQSIHKPYAIESTFNHDNSICYKKLMCFDVNQLFSSKWKKPKKKLIVNWITDFDIFIMYEHFDFWLFNWEYLIDIWFGDIE